MPMDYDTSKNVKAAVDRQYMGAQATRSPKADLSQLSDRLIGIAGQLDDAIMNIRRSANNIFGPSPEPERALNGAELVDSTILSLVNRIEGQLRELNAQSNRF